VRNPDQGQQDDHAVDARQGREELDHAEEKLCADIQQSMSLGVR